MDLGAFLRTTAPALPPAPLLGRSGNRPMLVSVGPDAGGHAAAGRRALLCLSCNYRRGDGVKAKCSKYEGQDDPFLAEADIGGMVNALAVHYGSVLSRMGPGPALSEQEEQIRQELLTVVEDSVELAKKVITTLKPEPNSPEFVELFKLTADLVRIAQTCKHGYAPIGHALHVISDLDALRRQVSIVKGSALPPAPPLHGAAQLSNEVVFWVLESVLKSVKNDIERMISDH
ncbi:uncharacterized protein LOC107304609 isoform X2 [Oryza brachyantha]|uniref:uncharacterized protein LOC107304609 isoform X2 n=1 Tax=Oryza brachyantha TaxID=4533 RepID=UPI0007760955|nr:uncharacterized protein LOC107304609 isoform X2 [Oryza brachyantha]